MTSTTEAAERVRYDRQIRLWGKSTQQQLMKTHVHFTSARGALAEVAKNLVLAGVRSVSVAGATPVSACDAATNFLVQGGGSDGDGEGGADAPFEALCVRALSRCNPLVRVTRADSIGSCAADITVVVASARGAADVAAVLRDNAAADAVVVTAPVSAGGGVLALFFTRRGGKGDFSAQCAELLDDASQLLQRPAAFQRAVLSLHLADAVAAGGVGFAECVAAAVDVVERRQLNEITPEALAAAAAAAVAPPPGESEGVADVDSSTAVVLATQAGASIAQEIIAVVASTADPAAREPLRWMCCSADPTLVTVVG